MKLEVKIKIFLSGVLFLLATGINFAWSEVDISKVKASLQLDRAKVKMGDSVVLSIEVKSPKEYQIEIEEIGPKIQGLRIVDAGNDAVKEDEGELFFRKWYKLETDLSGSYVLPQTSISITEKIKENLSENSKKEIQTSEIFLEVESNLSKGDTSSDQSNVAELRDIKSIEKTAMTIPLWLWIILGVVTILIVSYVIYLFYFKKKEESLIERTIPPHQKALDELKELALALKPSSSADEFKRFHFSLSQIFRDYVEAVFSFNASDMTYDEIKKNFSNFKGATSELRKDFMLVMEKTEIVKFTDFSTTWDDSEFLRLKTINFVEQTMPRDILNSVGEEGEGVSI